MMVIIPAMTVIFSILMVFIHIVGIFPLLASFSLLIGTMELLKPYDLARKVDQTLKELYQRR